MVLTSKTTWTKMSVTWPIRSGIGPGMSGKRPLMSGIEPIMFGIGSMLSETWPMETSDVFDIVGHFHGISVQFPDITGHS